jgi:hypothetical protein
MVGDGCHFMENLLCTYDPKHVKAPQGIEGIKSLLYGWRIVHGIHQFSSMNVRKTRLFYVIFWWKNSVRKE